jgi:hypothetical protein
MDKLKAIFTDAKFLAALAVIVATVAGLFGVDWTEAGVQAWIAEAVAFVTVLAGSLYALKRGNDAAGKTTDGE